MTDHNEVYPFPPWKEDPETIDMLSELSRRQPEIDQETIKGVIEEVQKTSSHLPGEYRLQLAEKLLPLYNSVPKISLHKRDKDGNS